jgi:hypothetical protein
MPSPPLPTSPEESPAPEHATPPVPEIRPFGLTAPGPGAPLPGGQPVPPVPPPPPSPPGAMPPPPPGIWPAPPPGVTAMPNSGWAPFPESAMGFGWWRPRSVAEMVDIATVLFRLNFLALVAVVAAVEVPFAALYLWAQSALFTPSARANMTQFNDPRAVLVLLALALLHSLGLVVLMGAATRYVSERVLSRAVTFRSAWAPALRRAPALAATAVLLLLAAMAPVAASALVELVASPLGALSIFLTLPLAIHIGIRVSMAPQVLILEGAGPVQALRRSWRLLRGSVWRTVGLMALVFLVLLGVGEGLVIVLELLLIYLPSALGVHISADALLPLQSVITSAANVLTLPLYPAAFTLFYYDLRVRREAFDIEMLATAL